MSEVEHQSWRHPRSDIEPTQNRFGAATRSELAAIWREDEVEASLFALLIGGLAWAPFWLGGNRLPAWGINGLLFPALAFLYELRILLTGRRHPISLRRIAGPAALFFMALGWIFIQSSTLVPAPFAHPIWSMASEILERPIDGAISVNCGETTLALLRLTTAASVFWLALQLSAKSIRAHMLLRAIALIVAGYSAYGLLLAAFYSGAIPFFEPLTKSLSIRSTFVNRNSFATYAGLGLVTSLALVFRIIRHEPPAAEGLRPYSLSNLLEASRRRGWILLGASFVTAVALLGSASRGGILATALGLFSLFVLTFSRRQRRRSERFEAIVFVTVTLVGTFVFFGDPIVGRIGSSGVEDANRLAVYVIVVRAILDSPMLGFGYGAFADVFPMYRDQSIASTIVFDKAHNSYLEAWLGLGLVFGSALIASPAWLAIKCHIGAVQRHQNATPAVVAAACSLIVGAHAMVDFSLQIEGVALTYMAILGAGVAQAETSRILVSD